MDRQEREEFVCARAYQLAETGQHIDCITIVSALVEEGFPDAQDILNNELIRADLRRKCAKHWERDEDVAMAAPATFRMPRRSNAFPRKG